MKQFHADRSICELGEIASIEIGRTPSRAVQRFWAGEQSWLSISDFDHGDFITSTKEKISRVAINESGIRVHDAGTLVMSFKLTIGKIGILGTPMATNEAIAAIKPLGTDRLDQRYLFHCLSSFDFTPFLDRASKGKTLNKAKLGRLKIAFPTDVNEQRRIAAVLDKADAIRRKREQALALADDFIRSLFLEMFGDPVVNPKRLPKQPLGKFGKIVTGNTPPRSDPENFGDAIEWIKSDNVNTGGHFLTRAVEGLSEKGKALGRVVPKGSILVTCIAGSPSSIGRAAIADRAVALNQQINAITPNPDVNPYFLYSQFLIGKSLVLRSSTNSMKGMISKGEFQKIEFLRPEPDEQKRFGGIFEKHIEAGKLLREAADCSIDLSRTLTQRAFRSGF
jgi:type I restriction enzyme, S subunit